MKPRLSTSNLLVAIFLSLYFGLAGVFFFASRKPDFNNSLHALWPYWPELDRSTEEHKQFIVSADESKEAVSRRILMRLGGQDLNFIDQPIEQNLQLDSAYTGSSDEPTLETTSAGGILEILIDRMRKEVNLPLGPRTHAQYTVQLGNLETPTLVDLDIVTGVAHFTLDEANITSLDVTAESAEVVSRLSGKALPTEKLVAQVTNARQTIHLPANQSLSINYVTETQDDKPRSMELIIDGVTRAISGTNSLSIPGLNPAVIVEVKIEESGTIELIRDL